MNPQFPRRTARVVTMPATGDIVFVKTLNSLQKEEVEREANFSAALACRRYRKGGEGYQSVQETFADMGVDGQVDFLVSQGDLTGVYLYEAAQAFPEPVRPDRLDKESEADYSIRVEAYDAAVDNTIKERTAMIEQKRATVAEDARKLTNKQRLDKCSRYFLDREYAVAYTRQHTVETLLRAVRNPDNNSEFHFSGAAVVTDLEDEDRMFLVSTYQELDSVRAVEIPT